MINKFQKEILEDSNSTAVSIFAATAQIFDDLEFLTYDDDTFRTFYKHKGVNISEYNINKLMGSIMTVTDEIVFKYPTNFSLAVNSVVNGLATGLPEDIITVEEIAQFLVDCKFLVPDFKLSEDVSGLIIETLKNEGFWRVPKIMSKLTGISLKENIPEIPENLIKEAFELQKEKEEIIENSIKEEIYFIKIDLEKLGLTPEEISNSVLVK